MRKIFLFPYVLMFLFALPTSSNATIITFEDFASNTTNLSPLPDGYGGFNWSVSDRTPSTFLPVKAVNGPYTHPGSGYEYGAVSGVITAFNSEGLTPAM